MMEIKQLIMYRLKKSIIKRITKLPFIEIYRQPPHDRAQVVSLFFFIKARFTAVIKKKKSAVYYYTLAAQLTAHGPSDDYWAPGCRPRYIIIQTALAFALFHFSFSLTTCANISIFTSPVKLFKCFPPFKNVSVANPILGLKEIYIY